MISNIIALFQSCKFWLPSWSHTNFRVLIVVKSLCIIYILRFHGSGNAKGGNPGLKFGSAGWPASRAYDPRIRPVGSTDFEFFFQKINFPNLNGGRWKCCQTWRKVISGKLWAIWGQSRAASRVAARGSIGHVRVSDQPNLQQFLEFKVAGDCKWPSGWAQTVAESYQLIPMRLQPRLLRDRWPLLWSQRWKQGSLSVTC